MANKKNVLTIGKKVVDLVLVKRFPGEQILPYRKEIADRLVRKGIGEIVDVKVEKVSRKTSNEKPPEDVEKDVEKDEVTTEKDETPDEGDDTAEGQETPQDKKKKRGNLF